MPKPLRQWGWHGLKQNAAGARHPRVFSRVPYVNRMLRACFDGCAWLTYCGRYMTVAPSSSSAALYPTPYEAGNQNQTTTWAACVAFYQRLAAAFPTILQFTQIGFSDGGWPMHAGVVTADGVFDRATLQQAQRPVFFNNNGIHPGEPEGIDVCMAVVRDFCVDPMRLAALGETVFVFIPIYNVDGSNQRQNTTRVNQVGPEQFGFRGNDLNLDLNRDFVKCDSLSAQAFNQFFSSWDPAVMVDTHTSNGADYSYTMTLIATQSDKLGGALGEFWRTQMQPAIYQTMATLGWPTCPYVNPIDELLDDGIVEFLETGRYSTGYAALHHTIGMMPETHMLKPFADRYAATRALVETVLAYTVANAAMIVQLRNKAKHAAANRQTWPVSWQMDKTRPSKFRFKGYAAVYTPSQLGSYQRLAYDRSQPWEQDIVYYNRFIDDAVVATPKAYLLSQAWREVISRLRWNNVALQRLTHDQLFEVECYRFAQVSTRPTAYEGHLFHDEVTLTTATENVVARAGDYIVLLNQASARYLVETLEPLGHDSFFRWGFFDSVLERKEHYSDYVFEDSAGELLRTEPGLQEKFTQWKVAHPELVTKQTAVLDFLFEHAAACTEPSWRRYPVFRLGAVATEAALQNVGQ